MTYASKADLRIETTPEKASPHASVLPRAFIQWQIESRAELCRTLALRGPQGVRTMPSHLAVLASRSGEGEINLATKGIGLMPKPNRLEEFTILFRRAADASVGAASGSGIKGRVDALMTLYSDPSNMDDTRLGGLEIFEGSTFRNLSLDPRASLLFTGDAPAFISYQVDGTVEFVSKGNPHFEFMLAARELFARDSFHVHQSDYPHGFVLNVTNVRDKRPFSRTGPHVR